MTAYAAQSSLMKIAYARSSYHAVDRQTCFLRATEMVVRTHVADG
jgi:hypothetical protein